MDFYWRKSFLFSFAKESARQMNGFGNMVFNILRSWNVSDLSSSLWCDTLASWYSCLFFLTKIMYTYAYYAFLWVGLFLSFCWFLFVRFIMYWCMLLVLQVFTLGYLLLIHNVGKNVDESLNNYYLLDEVNVLVLFKVKCKWWVFNSCFRSVLNVVRGSSDWDGSIAIILLLLNYLL